jgi:hypothetical protein
VNASVFPGRQGSVIRRGRPADALASYAARLRCAIATRMPFNQQADASRAVVEPIRIPQCEHHQAVLCRLPYRGIHPRLGKVRLE